MQGAVYLSPATIIKILIRWAGVSIGSAVAALYCNGYTPDELTGILHQEFQAFYQQNYLKAKSIWSFAFVNLLPFFQQMVQKYNCSAKPNLQMVTYDPIRMKPLLFTGTGYDLAVGLAASCAIPVLMQPVWLGPMRTIGSFRAVLRRLRGRSEDTYLVDGGIYHPAPGSFAKGPAIISRLGTARTMPVEKLSKLEYVSQVIEVVATRFFRRHLPEEKGHITIRSGKPDVGTLAFGGSRKMAGEMVAYGYWAACPVLDRAIASGMVPIKAGTLEQDAG